MSNLKPEPKAKWWQVALFIPFAPVLLVVVVLALAFFLVSTICLHIAILVVFRQ